MQRGRAREGSDEGVEGRRRRRRRRKATQAGKAEPSLMISALFVHEEAQRVRQGVVLVLDCEGVPLLPGIRAHGIIHDGSTTRMQAI